MSTIPTFLCCLVLLVALFLLSFDLSSDCSSGSTGRMLLTASSCSKSSSMRRDGFGVKYSGFLHIQNPRTFPHISQIGCLT